uniref:Uncharacterized protein n=1 Tax=Anguilla anguilla TaxID=7936 RepID=A0A0E9VLM1_ANGAN
MIGNYMQLILGSSFFFFSFVLSVLH